MVLILTCLLSGRAFAIYDGPIDQVDVAFSPRGDGLPMILEELKRARTSVDVAMFYLSNDILIDALCFIANRTPAAVRVIVDEGMSQGEHRATLDRLKRSGASVYVEDLPRSGKLHLKVAILDQATVLSGSSNWTEFAFRSNCEDTLALRSRTLTSRYGEAFEEVLGRARIWKGRARGSGGIPDEFPDAGRFRAGKQDGSLRAPPKGRFRNVRRIEVYLTPSSNGVSRLVECIGEADHRVDVGIFYLSDQRVVQALCTAASSGKLRVRVLTDDMMVGGPRRGPLERLQECGAEVYCRKAEAASMHLKTAVVDDEVVVSGSHNWTRSASERNVEDMIFFHSGEMARYYRAYLNDLVERHAEPWRANPESILPRARQRASARRAELDQDPFPESLPPTGPRTDFAQAGARPPEATLALRGAAAYLDDEAYLPVLLDLIETARQSILVAMHMVAPHEGAPAVHQVLNALGEAAERGIFVYVVLDTPLHSEDRRSALHSEVADRLRRRGVDVRLGIPGRTVHEKVVIVDLAKVVVGSHNWTEGSLSGTTVDEASALILLPAQEPALAHRILRHPIISDMRNRSAWEREIAAFRGLHGWEGGASAEALHRLETAR
jgi:phosphatidylserine/phosphatidylglycerophosphate/cardiolipin synthase-like enzyme